MNKNFRARTVRQQISTFVEREAFCKLTKVNPSLRLLLERRFIIEYPTILTLPSMINESEKGRV